MYNEGVEYQDLYKNKDDLLNFFKQKNIFRFKRLYIFIRSYVCKVWILRWKVFQEQVWVMTYVQSDS